MQKCTSWNVCCLIRIFPIFSICLHLFFLLITWLHSIFQGRRLWEFTEAFTCVYGHRQIIDDDNGKISRTPVYYNLIHGNIYNKQLILTSKQTSSIKYNVYMECFNIVEQKYELIFLFIVNLYLKRIYFSYNRIHRTIINHRFNEIYEPYPFINVIICCFFYIKWYLTILGNRLHYPHHDY